MANSFINLAFTTINYHMNMRQRKDLPIQLREEGAPSSSSATATTFTDSDPITTATPTIKQASAHSTTVDDDVEQMVARLLKEPTFLLNVKAADVGWSNRVGQGTYKTCSLVHRQDNGKYSTQWLTLVGTVVFAKWTEQAKMYELTLHLPDDRAAFSETLRRAMRTSEWDAHAYALLAHASNHCGPSRAAAPEEFKRMVRSDLIRFKRTQRDRGDLHVYDVDDKELSVEEVCSGDLVSVECVLQSYVYEDTASGATTTGCKLVPHVVCLLQKSVVESQYTSMRERIEDLAPPRRNLRKGG